MTNAYNSTFYIGVTNDLTRRVYEHKNKIVKGFTNQYNLTKLVYYEEGSNGKDAIMREKQLKNWHRQWKITLIRSINPTMKDMSIDY